MIVDKARKLFSQSKLIILLSMMLFQTTQAGELDYQKRSFYWEGIKSDPVGSLGLELVSAIVDYQEQPNDLDSDFRARFFLKNTDSVCLVISERDNQHYYWLDKINPVEPWRLGYHNEFVWSPKMVIKPLNLNLYNLGVVARLSCDTPTPRADEQITPVVLYQKQLPQIITSYVFRFKLDESLNLKLQVYSDTDNKKIYELNLGEKTGPGAFDIVWPTQQNPANKGNYTIKLSGYRLSNNTPISQIIRFHHLPSLID